MGSNLVPGPGLRFGVIEFRWKGVNSQIPEGNFIKKNHVKKDYPLTQVKQCNFWTVQDFSLVKYMLDY